MCDEQHIGLPDPRAPIHASARCSRCSACSPWTNKNYKDAVRQLRPQRHELFDEHRPFVDVRQCPAEPVADPGLLWLGGASVPTPPTTPPTTPPSATLISPTAWFVNRNSGKCLDVPAASTADSVQLVQYACNGTGAQSYRLVQQS
jgi:Ricin-type beta-trefoil lectin domain-like